MSEVPGPGSEPLEINAFVTHGERTICSAPAGLMDLTLYQTKQKRDSIFNVSTLHRGEATLSRVAIDHFDTRRAIITDFALHQKP